VNGTASYPSAGTYVAQCVVRDAAGSQVVASVFVNVRPVAPPPSVTAPEVLVGSVGTGGALAAAVGTYRRRDALTERASAIARWLPPTGPAATVHGTKTCPRCGVANLPLRSTCQACGAPLPRNPAR